MAAIEYANLLDVTHVEMGLAAAFLDDPWEVLRTLHGHICQGLVARDVIGRPRQTDQAVHDGTQGMVIYAAPKPDAAAAMTDDLMDWIRNRTLSMHPAIVAGVVHERILQAQPFEAGNGRVARAATRLALIAHGVDTSGAAVVEEELMADAGGYYGEVAATMRRADDLLPWLERHTGVLARALERAVDDLAPRPRPVPPERGRAVIGRLLPDATINVRTYATEAGVDLRTARADLGVFARAGEVAEMPQGRGLIFRRVSPSGASAN